jgi:23S rRNA (pseudouridine1915-N3)-methyltransferase
MRLTIVAVGRLKKGPERELVARYAERIAAGGRAVGFGQFELREIEEGRARRTEDRRAEEAAAIRAACGAAPLVALDERGLDLTSETFAARLRQASETERALAFVIGGADGLDASILDHAAWRIRLGAMTLPHQFARIVLVEQIYRATTILAGHPYHRA